MTALPAGRARAEEFSAPNAVRPEVQRISFHEAIERAITRNPNWTVAIEEAKRLDALAVEVRSQALPSLMANGYYTRLDHDRKINGVIIQHADQLSGNFNLNVPMVVPRLWLLTRRARDDASVARRDALEVRRQLALNTAHAYLLVVLQHRVIDVDQRALENARAHYHYTHTRYEGGIGNQLDDVRAAQDVANGEAALESALQQLTQAQEALGVLVGADGPRDAEQSPDIGLLPSVDPEKAPDRPDILAGQRRVWAARRLLRSTWADYSPTLTGYFLPFTQHPPQPLNPRLGWQAGLVFTVPLVMGGLRIGLKQEREAALAQSRAQLEGVVRQAKSDVRVALAAIERADAALVASARAAELAAQTLQMADVAYRTGATTNIEVIDAERRARDAETSAVMAEDTARRARVDLLSATGNLP